MEGVDQELRITLDILRENLKKNEETIALLIEENRALRQELVELKKQVNTRKSFNDKIVKKIKRQKKNIIKSKILEFLSIKPYVLAELKDLIVDDLNYCSKASFYRYIEDLQRESLINLIKKDSTTIAMKNEEITSKVV